MCNSSRRRLGGPLNPYAERPERLSEGFTVHRMHPTGFETGKGLRVALKPSHGASLLALGAELLWATTWEHEANEWIGPHIGLPELPVITFPEPDYWNPERLYWKTKRIVQWMNDNRTGIPFLWLDDEITKRDNMWIADFAAPGSIAMAISPKTGITDEHLEKIKEWINTGGAAVSEPADLQEN